MKVRKNIYLHLVIIIALIYIALLTILYCSESAESDAMIQTFGDAFWYSLVTLTTVGYGDLVPITPLGHAVGMIFLLLSAGITVTLLGAVISFITSEGMPFLMLNMQRRKNWYYFADYEVESDTLAANIYKEDPDALIIYGEERNRYREKRDYPCIYVNVSPDKIVEKKKEVGAKCKIFLMKENDIEVNSRAAHLDKLPVEVYARSTNGRDNLSGNINFFHSYECCARQYWRSKPLCCNENSIVLIGFGNYGRSILERAVLTNIVSIHQHVAYHIFGDVGDFLTIHHRLNRVFSINEESATCDSLIFHENPWAEAHSILEQADRIIICEDDEQSGWSIFWTLNDYYRISGRVDLRSSRKAPGISYFGANEDIYTPQQIIRTDLNKAAIMINELFRKSVSYPTRSWEELDDLHRQSKIVAADHLLMKTRILLEDETITELNASVVKRAYDKYCKTSTSEEGKEVYRKLDHMRAVRFYTFYNWSYGLARNDIKREHPMLCQYEELTQEQKRERDASWELMGNIYTKLE
ncbi:ion channel [Parablautia muri]|uniref:Potassium channel domain-containing protein n=1 Tax=Parablautia muri TaxID=2320879 RepID=A0A9X5BHE7_9FIRM|nr:ion channel [Parablautia muri]NBJ94156.1 hypothetical protein [Parablautia muri]